MMERYFTQVALRPLSSLPRDGGDVRGGSFDFLGAAPPRSVSGFSFSDSSPKERCDLLG
jgi:hypothetical protein